MRTAPQAIALAKSQTRNTPGMCQKWTRDLFGAPSAGDRDGDKDADAVDGWKSEPASARRTDRKPDIGAPGAWSGGSGGFGHRAICIGYLNGEPLFRSTDGAGRGIIGNHTLSWFEKNWKLKWLGWSKTITGKPIEGLVPAPGSTPTKAPAKTAPTKPATSPALSPTGKAYLELHPNPNRQMRPRQRNKFGFTGVTGGIVIHSAESPADTVGPDSGTLNVANFISKRAGATNKGSYHSLADSDSRLRVVPFSMCAYGEGTGGNDYAIHLSVAVSAAQWPKLPANWKTGAIENLAQEALDAAKHVYATRKVIVPAKRISAAEYRAGKPGFVTHGELDPGRRTDPGKDFPWTAFLARYAMLYKAWNFGKKVANPAPVVKKTEPKPKDKSFHMVLGTANVFDKLNERDAKKEFQWMEDHAGVVAFQELFSNEDWVWLREVMDKQYFLSPNPAREIADPKRPGKKKTNPEHWDKRANTSYINGNKFAFVSHKEVRLPSNAKIFGGLRYLDVLEFKPKHAVSPNIVLLNVHIIHKAWTKGQPRFNKENQALWNAQYAAISKIANAERAKGKIVLIVGDFNRRTQDLPKIANDQIRVLGVKNTIDSGWLLLPKTVKVKVSKEILHNGPSDHDKRAVRLDFTFVG